MYNSCINKNIKDEGSISKMKNMLDVVTADWNQSEIVNIRI